MTDFSKNLIKEYKYWDVYIHENQGYLGRCVVWCKRSDAEDLVEASVNEKAELFEILAEIKKAISSAFSPDRFNYSFLGNNLKHLHAHVVPRYAESKEFMGITFEDKLYGHNYKTDHDFITPLEVRQAICEKIKSAI